MRKYLPDFIVLVDDGHGDDDLLHLSSRSRATARGRQGEEVHDGHLLGARREQPRHHGRWAFAEFTEVYQIEADFKAKVESEFNKMIESVSARHRPGDVGK
jgi:type III restriction enzyme